MNQVQINKMKVLITVGILEVKFENSEKLHDELSSLRKSLLDDAVFDVAFDAAVYFGHLIQRLKDQGIKDVDEYVNEIHEYLLGEAYYKVNDILDVDVKVNEESPIEYLGLKARTRKVLKNKNIKTVGQLINCSKNELYTIRGIGPGSLEDIINKLRYHNLILKN